MPHTSIKGQVLVDLVAEFTECPEEISVEKHGLNEKSVGLISTQCFSPWEGMWMGQQTNEDQE